MATTSVALPPSASHPNEDTAMDDLEVPAMLDRVRGLTGIGATGETATGSSLPARRLIAVAPRGYSPTVTECPPSPNPPPPSALTGTGNGPSTNTRLDGASGQNQNQNQGRSDISGGGRGHQRCQKSLSLGRSVEAAEASSTDTLSSSNSAATGSVSTTSTSTTTATPTAGPDSHRRTQAGRITKTRLRLQPDSTSKTQGASLTSSPDPTASGSGDASRDHRNLQKRPHPDHSTHNKNKQHKHHHRSSSYSHIQRPRHHHQPHSYSSTASSSSKDSTAASAMSTTTTTDTHAPVLSFWGPDPVPLPSRFARIKRNLIAGHEDELEACWARLIRALRTEVEHIEGLGAHLIPSIEFADTEDPAQTARFGRDLKRYGVGVVRKVVPKAHADDMVQGTVNYLDRLAAGNKPLQVDPTCYDYFWTPAQVLSRAHPSVLKAQRFMMGLWEANPDAGLAPKLPITYVDRIRIHGASGSMSNADQSPANGLSSPPSAPPQSADDWIAALQSSAGVIAQVDNGSLERWEPDGYGRGGTYSRVFHGRWEDYDPWECTSRVSSTIDLYNGYAACTIFRMFQGVLALSTIEPGMIRLLPSPKLATAYYLLRPFFSPKTPAPEVRSGPAWEAYLAPENWKLEKEPDTIIHGAVPGHAQRITEHWHPHLHLRGSMITLPTLQPGDYIFWHPDLPYHISSNNPGLKTPGGHDGEVNILVYIPAAPLTQTNALYLARQRKAFQRGNPGPDFDSSGRGLIVEDNENRPGEEEVAEIGGVAGLQAMGLAPWEVAGTRVPTPPGGDDEKENDQETEKDSTSKTTRENSAEKNGDGETKSITSSAGSHAEAEVVRLSNIILFPDRSMMGYSV